MNQLAKPELTKSLPEFGASLAQITSNMTSRFSEQSEALANMITEWNGEISQFVSHRLQRNGEALGSMTKCQSLPEVFAIQGQWFQQVADDYLKEASRLMEVNSRCMRRVFEPVGEHRTQAPTAPRSAPASIPVRTREHSQRELTS